VKIYGYPLPLIKQLITDLLEGKSFWEIDLKAAYNQIMIKKAKKHLTVFQTPFGNTLHYVQFTLCFPENDNRGSFPSFGPRGMIVPWWHTYTFKNIRTNKEKVMEVLTLVSNSNIYNQRKNMLYA
jgi:hypothetical protein